MHFKIDDLRSNIEFGKNIVEENTQDSKWLITYIQYNLYTVYTQHLIGFYTFLFLNILIVRKRITRLHIYGTRRSASKFSMSKSKKSKRVKREKAHQQQTTNSSEGEKELFSPTGLFSRKQPIIVSSNNNNMHALLEPKRTVGMSPIGGFARLLMAGLLERKNRTKTIP